MFGNENCYVYREGDDLTAKFTLESGDADGGEGRYYAFAKLALEVEEWESGGIVYCEENEYIDDEYDKADVDSDCKEMFDDMLKAIHASEGDVYLHEGMEVA